MTRNLRSRSVTNNFQPEPSRDGLPGPSISDSCHFFGSRDHRKKKNNVKQSQPKQCTNTFFSGNIPRYLSKLRRNNYLHSSLIPSFFWGGANWIRACFLRVFLWTHNLRVIFFIWIFFRSPCNRQIRDTEGFFGSTKVLAAAKGSTDRGARGCNGKG